MARRLADCQPVWTVGRVDAGLPYSASTPRSNAEARLLQAPASVLCFIFADRSGIEVCSAELSSTNLTISKVANYSMVYDKVCQKK
jgi:hypothetical protein